MPETLVIEGALGLYETDAGTQPADIRIAGVFLAQALAEHLGIQGEKVFSVQAGGQELGLVRLTIEFLEGA